MIDSGGASTQPVRFFRPELDALRFGAFLLVFGSHALPKSRVEYGSLPDWLADFAVLWSRIGGFGVDLFFLLSSYLITELLVREQKRFGRIDLKLFYVRRALRIWPLYFAFVGFGLFVAPWFWPDLRIGHREALSYLTFTNNWFIGWTGWSGDNTILGPLWSVSIEEQFYVVWPLLLGLLGVGRVRRMAVAMLGVAVLARLYLSATGAPPASVWTNTFARLDPIALGALLAVTLRGKAPRFSKVVRLALSLGCFAAWLFGVWVNLPVAYRYPMVSLGSAALLLSCLSEQPGRFLTQPTITYLGRISFGLYVFHELGIRLVGSYVRRPWPVWAVGSLAITIVLAMLSYQWLERPFLRWKEKFSRVASRPV